MKVTNAIITALKGFIGYSETAQSSRNEDPKTISKGTKDEFKATSDKDEEQLMFYAKTFSNEISKTVKDEGIILPTNEADRSSLEKLLAARFLFDHRKAFDRTKSEELLSKHFPTLKSAIEKSFIKNDEPVREKAFSDLKKLERIQAYLHPKEEVYFSKAEFKEGEATSNTGKRIYNRHDVNNKTSLIYLLFNTLTEVVIKQHNGDLDKAQSVVEHLLYPKKLPDGSEKDLTVIFYSTMPDKYKGGFYDEKTHTVHIDNSMFLSALAQNKLAKEIKVPEGFEKAVLQLIKK